MIDISSLTQELYMISSLYNQAKYYKMSYRDAFFLAAP